MCVCVFYGCVFVYERVQYIQAGSVHVCICLYVS